MAMKPFLDEARAMNFTVTAETVSTALANDLMFSDDTELGVNVVMGSRLIPAEAYRTNATGIGKGYTALLELGLPEQVPSLLRSARRTNFYSLIHY